MIGVWKRGVRWSDQCLEEGGEEGGEEGVKRGVVMKCGAQ